MALDPTQGLWQKTTLCTPDGDSYQLSRCNVWSTPKTRLTGTGEVLADIPLSEVPVESPDTLHGWGIEIGPDLGEPVVVGTITDVGATLEGIDWQTVVIAPLVEEEAAVTDQ